jgi:hypothetical protein
MNFRMAQPTFEQFVEKNIKQLQYIYSTTIICLNPDVTFDAFCKFAYSQSF